jgi:uncharacterized protein YpmS
MARKHRIALLALAATVTALVALVLGGGYVALGRVRPFYVAALALDPPTLKLRSRELESRATALYSEAKQPGQWQAAFTADQINGWLATQLADDYADALPDDVSEPRVAIDEDRLLLGFRARRGGVETVVSADASVMLTEEGDVAIRLVSVHAGSLPLPVMQVADDVSKACQGLGLPIRWTQVEGQPVALVDVNHTESARKRRLVLDTVELHDGAVYVAGHTIAEETDGEVTKE